MSDLLHFWMASHVPQEMSDLPQMRRAPIVKVLYKQTNIGFAAEAVFFGGGERGRFAQKRV